MHWFEWLDQIVAHACNSRQHEAPIEGHDPLSRAKDEDLEATAEPHPFGGCMGGNNLVRYPVFICRVAV